MNLLILTHDAVETLDRRIVNEARLFVEHGWTVRIVLTSYADDAQPHELEPGIVVDPVPVRSLKPVYDSGFHEKSFLPLKSRVRDMLASGPISKLPGYYTLKTAYRLLSSGAARRFLGRARRALFGTHAGKSNGAVTAPVGVAELPGGVAEVVETKQEPPPSINPYWYPLPFTTSFLERVMPLAADAVMVCDLPSLPAGLTFSLRRKLPLIYDAHEFYVEQAVFSQQQKNILEHHERRGIRHASLCITVSPPISDELQQRYTLRERPLVIFNSPEFRSDKPEVDVQRVRRVLGLGPNEPYVLYHGGLVNGRNLQRLMKAFHALDQRRLRLVMLGYGDLTDELKNLAAGMGGRVLVHDAVPQDELFHWVGGAEVCVIPYLTTEKNYEYALPNKLFDCIELGTPFIANERLVSIRQIVERLPIGWQGPMETDQEMRQTLQEGLNWIERVGRQKDAFQAARDTYGWSAQRAALRASFQRIGLPGF